ncbi:mycofactocin dehydrogenase MftG [Mycolicibacterium vaccae]|uniref:Glucose-methanol-choline oxidoreductase n=1 Tax=Mycolicibacterium vaccae ATCC 25954 TaxID=1194972 RepID=K0VIH4_MYCVA|nr:mycofactocin system GMC family oxidoreductase MftG [Mycolicibacterium vaccae]ANI38330.1 glucose-methanol-choline oxidoreductase [Mycolicibacterium vaccae 95051]EJZ10884.1 glucose-methanol-choline oxidoreductase [Mycolicibacterium vaccae ATCC 25954]MCV7064318.1 mycofactocin system GMC family oxidoreductase MftG [Mycolicibacterium vaccae]
MRVLIVGAGSAGSVLAERISAVDGCHVTVVEAGPGPFDPRVGTQITDGLRLPIGSASSVVRRYRTTLTDDPRRHAEIMRGAVVGGSGAINGGYFCRALPTDVDGWGVPGWSWSDVLPHFVAIENDLDFGAPPHGSAGPITVRRVAEFDGCTASFVRACRAAGFGWIEDLNGSTPGHPLPPGVGAVPLNIYGGTRVGPGGAFLQPALQRPNLALRPDTRVRRLRFSGGRVVGADCVGPDGPATLTADRVVLCAGAIASAQLLMVSGIGPQRVLAAAGVDVEIDLPVGVDTVDHPEWVLPVNWLPTHGVPPLEAVLTTGDGLEIRPYTAGFGAMTTGDRADPADQPHLGVTLMRPRSRGRLAIVAADPDVPPVIEHHYDSEPADVELLRSGTRLAHELAGATVQSEASWATSQHLCGTAKMGAVVDERCRVYGVDNLWVVDGSILPDIPSRGPHATIVMAGHRAAEFVSSAYASA